MAEICKQVEKQLITVLHTCGHGTICFVCRRDPENQSPPLMAQAFYEYAETSSIKHDILQRYPSYMTHILYYPTYISIGQGLTG